MKPLLRYAGGKTQLLPILQNFFPKSGNTFYEPFVGSMAVTLFVIAELNYKHIIVSDLNKDLINFYLTIQQNVENFLHELAIPHKYLNNEITYYKNRELFNSIRVAEQPTLLEDTVEKAALFYYLNKTCFNGLYRVNKNGFYNVPYGKRKKATIDSATIRVFSTYIQPVKFHCCTFQDFLRDRQLVKEDLIYCDPPYDGTFVSYQSKGFNEENQTELFIKLNKEYLHCTIVLNNSNTDFIKNLWSLWNITIVSATRMINSDATKRTKKNIEVIITNK